MPKSRYYQHRAGRHSLARFVLLVVLLCGTGFAGYKKYSGSLTWGFNPQKLVADSVLSGKTFETEVREVVSPRAKIKAYLFEDRTNPIISVSFLFKNAGLANDAESEVGISGMAASLLTTGAGDMDRLQFSEELEDRAVSIGFSAGRDGFDTAEICSGGYCPGQSGTAVIAETTAGASGTGFGSVGGKGFVRDPSLWAQSVGRGRRYSCRYPRKTVGICAESSGAQQFDCRHCRRYNAGGSRSHAG